MRQTGRREHLWYADVTVYCLLRSPDYGDHLDKTHSAAVAGSVELVDAGSVLGLGTAVHECILRHLIQ